MKYEINYSSFVTITDKEANKKVMSLPYGAIGTPAFTKIKKQLESTGGVDEIFDFYPYSPIMNGTSTLPFKPDYKHRKYQQNTASYLVSKNKHCGIVEAPTGSGKTNIFATLIAYKNISSIIIVPSTDLVFQTKERLLNILDIDPNLIGACADNIKELNRPILVSTWQSLQNSKTFASVYHYGYNMVIVDEVHKASASVLSKIVSTLKSQYKFGFSASVYRTQEKQLFDIYKIIGNKIVEIDIEMLYSKSYLIRPSIETFKTNTPLTIEHGLIYYFAEKLNNNEKMRWALANRFYKEPKYREIAPKNKTIKQVALTPTEQEILHLAGIARDDYLEKLTSQESNEKDIFSKKLGIAKTGIDNYRPRFKKLLSKAFRFFNSKTEKGIILFNTIQAGEKFASKLSEKFDNVFVINGGARDNAVMQKIVSGEISNYLLVSTTAFLGEGKDIPSIEKIFIGSPVYPPFFDAARLQQIIGRGMRPDELKKRCLVLLADDTTIGWIHAKKDNTYNMIKKILHPSFRTDSKKIVLISGEKRSGKSESASIIYSELKENKIKASILAFADPLKNITSKIFNIDRETLDMYKDEPLIYTIEVNDKKVSLKKRGVIFDSISKVDIFKRFSIAFYEEFSEYHELKKDEAKQILKSVFDENLTNFRKVLQKLGFDGILKVYPSILSEKLFSRIYTSESDIILLSDLRLPDEFKSIKEEFKDTISIKIIKDNSEHHSADEHPTESNISSLNVDFNILNNGTTTELKEKLVELTENFILNKKKDKNIAVDANKAEILVEPDSNMPIF